MENTINPTRLAGELRQFVGTTQWYRFNPLMPKFLLTDGTHYVAEKCEAYWLMDLIASCTDREERMNVFTITRQPDGEATLTHTDGNYRELTPKQTIEFTDFPLETLTLWVEGPSDGHYVILLPSEH